MGVEPTSSGFAVRRLAVRPRRPRVKKRAGMSSPGIEPGLRPSQSRVPSATPRGLRLDRQAMPRPGVEPGPAASKAAAHPTRSRGTSSVAIPSRGLEPRPRPSEGRMPSVTTRGLGSRDFDCQRTRGSPPIARFPCFASLAVAVEPRRFTVRSSVDALRRRNVRAIFVLLRERAEAPGKDRSATRRASGPPRPTAAESATSLDNGLNLPTSREVDRGSRGGHRGPRPRAIDRAPRPRTDSAIVAISPRSWIVGRRD